MPELRCVLHIVEASFAGVGRHVIDLANEQARMGHDVHVAFSPARESATFRNEREASSAVTFHSVTMTRSAGLVDLRAAISLASLVRSLRPSVIHGHSTKGGLMARLVPRRQAAVLYTPNATYSMNPNLGATARTLVGRVERALSRRTDRIIAVSPEEAEHLRHIGVAADKITVVPNGITPEDPTDRSEVRSTLDLSTTATVFGFVGRLDDQKAPLTLIKSFVEMAVDHPEAHLAIVGDGPLRADLETARNASPVADRIHLLGEQPGRWAMAAFDVFVLPSNYEGFPYVLIEAAQSGLPIVASDRACARQLIPDSDHGRIVPAGDHHALAAALAELVDHDTRRELSSAVTLAASGFTVRGMTDGVEAAMADL